VTVLIHRGAESEFDKLPVDMRKRIVRALEEFHDTGRGDVRHIRGALWALRVGVYRITYGKNTDLLVVGVDHRKSAYIPERVESLEKRIVR
jgi:mRNA-degrading endonuclease RelE of RelBE toxin-antitoxin system